MDIFFSWQPSSSDESGDNISYIIELGNSNEDIVAIYEGTDTSYVYPESLIDNSRYAWRVLALDSQGASVATPFRYFTVNQSNDAPGVFTLLAPNPGSIQTNLDPTFSWSASMDIDPGDIVSYEIFAWTASSNNNAIVEDSTWFSFDLDDGLEDNAEYSWYVSATDQTASTLSDTMVFYTDAFPEPPSSFALISPALEEVGLLLRPSFEWEVATDPDPLDYADYTIQIARDSLLVDIVHEASTGGEAGYSMIQDLPGDTEFWWKVIATDTDSLTTESEIFKFTVGYVSIAEELALPTEYVLDQNFPNPFNPSTTLRYGLPEAAAVSLVIYDIRGNAVKTIDSGNQTAGWYEHVWNGMDESGLYVVKVIRTDMLKT